jgi:hypothetical protein
MRAASLKDLQHCFCGEEGEAFSSPFPAIRKAFTLVSPTAVIRLIE